MFSLRNILLGRHVFRSTQVIYPITSLHTTKRSNSINFFGFQIRFKAFIIPCKLDEKINADLESEIYKPKDHAGKIRLGSIEIPEHISEAIQHGLQGRKICVLIKMNEQNRINEFSPLRAGNDVSKYIEEGARLDRHLFGRHVPMEQKDVFVERNKIKKELQQKATEQAPELGEVFQKRIQID